MKEKNYFAIMSFVGTYELQSICMTLMWLFWGFPGGSESKESSCNAGDPDLIPGSRRSPGERNGNPLWYSCLGNCMDRGAWQATVHGVPESDITEGLSLTLNHKTRLTPGFSVGRRKH